jgi:hypothetical protein
MMYSDPESMASEATTTCGMEDDFTEETHTSSKEGRATFTEAQYFPGRALQVHGRSTAIERPYEMQNSSCADEGYTKVLSKPGSNQGYSRALIASVRSYITDGEHSLDSC